MSRSLTKKSPAAPKKVFRSYAKQLKKGNTPLPQLQETANQLVALQPEYDQYAEYWLLRAVAHDLLHPSHRRHSSEQLARQRADRCNGMSPKLGHRYAKLLLTAAGRRQRRAASEDIYHRYGSTIRRAKKWLLPD